MLPEFQKAVACPLMQGCRLVLCESLRRPARQEAGREGVVWHLPAPRLRQTLLRAQPGPSPLCLRLLYHRLPPGCHSDWTEAPGLNTGGLLWIHTALRAGPAQVQPWYAVGPPCLQILKSHRWGALHLGWKLSRVQKGKEPALEDSF